VVSLIDIEARYEQSNEKEDAFCHPDVQHLVLRAHYHDTCNFTRFNSGEPWYCGRPKTKSLDCEHWKYVRYRYQDMTSYLNECEQQVLKR
jgi:hypothetical protein